MVWYTSPANQQELQSVTGPKLTSNSTTNASWSNIDHYGVSDLTSNNGFHNQTTMPLIIGAAHPTTTTYCRMYAMQDTAPLGLLNYSRGPNSATPTPLTNIYSSSSPITLINLGSAVNMLDFTGITLAMVTVKAFNATSPSNGYTCWQSIYWTGSAFIGTGGSGLGTTSSGSVLQLRFNSGGGPASITNVYWTLIFDRLQA